MATTFQHPHRGIVQHMPVAPATGFATAYHQRTVRPNHAGQVAFGDPRTTTVLTLPNTTTRPRHRTLIWTIAILGAVGGVAGVWATRADGGPHVVTNETYAVIGSPSSSTQAAQIPTSETPAAQTPAAQTSSPSAPATATASTPTTSGSRSNAQPKQKSRGRNA